MPIPPFTDGFLPDGTHECTLAEVEERFGSFQSTDRRVQLYRDLRRYCQDLTRADIARYVIVNGSFATSVDAPNDVDVLLVLRDDIDLSQEDIPPFRYNVRDKKYVRSEYKLDFYFGFEGDATTTQMIALWSQVRLQPDRTKGMLKVRL